MCARPRRTSSRFERCDRQSYVPSLALAELEASCLLDSGLSLSVQSVVNP